MFPESAQGDRHNGFIAKVNATPTARFSCPHPDVPSGANTKKRLWFTQPGALLLLWVKCSDLDSWAQAAFHVRQHKNGKIA